MRHNSTNRFYNRDDPIETKDDDYVGSLNNNRGAPPLTAISFAVIGEFSLLVVLCVLLLLYRLWRQFKLYMKQARAEIDKSKLVASRESISVTSRESL